MGLLDSFFGSPDQTQAMGLLGANMMQGNTGKGFADAIQYMGGSKDRDMERQVKAMQIQNMQSEIAQRAAAIKRAEDESKFGMALFNGGMGSGAGVPGAPNTPTPSSAGGAVPGAMPGATMSPAQALSTPQGRSWLSTLNEDQIAGLIKMGKLPAGTEKLWEIAKFGKEYKQGDFRVMSDGSQSMVPMVKEGLGYGPGGVSVLPGAADSQQQLTLANELAKAAAASAGRVNLRPNPDGTQSPVPELSENPLLQNYLRGQGGGQPPQAQPRPFGTQPQMQPRPMAPATPAVVPQPGMRGAFSGSPEQISAQIENIPDPQEKANARAAFESQMRSSGGRLGPYGKTTAQERSDKTSSAFGEAMAKQQADALDKSYNTAKTASDDLLGIAESRKSVQAGVYSGSGAETKLAIAKFFNANVPGVSIDPEKVGNTDYLKSTLGRGLLEQAKTLGSNPSNADANRINDIVGSIGKDPKAMVKILDWREEMAHRAIGQHNSRVDDAERRGYSAPYDMRVKAAEQKEQKAGGANIVPSLPKTAPKGTRARDVSTGDILEFNGLSWVKAK